MWKPRLTIDVGKVCFCLQLTLKQIKKALREVMVDAPVNAFMLTFKSGDRHIAPHKADDRAICGDENYYHVLMTTGLLHRLCPACLLPQGMHVTKQKPIPCDTVASLLMPG